MFGAYQFIRRNWGVVGPFVSILGLGWFFQLTPRQFLDFGEAAAPYVLQARMGGLILATVSLYFTYVHLRHRNVPLTVLHTEIDFIHETATGSRVRRHVKQRIRANHDNVTGYHRHISAPRGGKIPQSEYIATVDHCGEERQSVLFDGTDSAWEIIHSFDAIPRKVLGLHVIVREESALFVDAFLREEERFIIELPPRYRHRRLTVTVYFHQGRPCGEFRVLLINANGVSKPDFRKVPPKPGTVTGPGFQIDLTKPREGDRLQLRWRYQIGPTALAVVGAAEAYGGAEPGTGTPNS